MKCIHCGVVTSTTSHDGHCPYNPINLRKIALYCRDYAEMESRFNKNLKPFPPSKVLDKFLRDNSIVSLKTIRTHFFDGSDMKTEDWLSLLISIGLDIGIIDEEEFPIYILYIWDSWLFMSKEDYKKAYKMAVDYENGLNKDFVIDFDKSKFEIEKEVI